MVAAEITVSVEGQTPDLLAKPFLDAMGNSLEILRDLDANIAMRRRPTLRWAISHMHIGSPAVMTLRALSPPTGKDVSQDVVNHYVDGLELLAIGSGFLISFPRMHSTLLSGSPILQEGMNALSLFGPQTAQCR